MLAPEKSVGIAFLLTFLFGPLGMLYSTVVGALVMLGIEAIVTVVGWFLVAATFGLGLVILVPPGYFLIWVACILWGGCLAASGHNERSRAAAHAMAQSMALLSPTADHSRDTTSLPDSDRGGPSSAASGGAESSPGHPPRTTR